MIPVVEQSSLMIVAYWLLMFPVAVVVLVRVTDFWADSGPSTVFEAARAILFMGLAVFLTYDLSGYAFALMQSPQLGIVFPADYGYWNWIREPLCLKWQVLGFVPMIRYLPVLFVLMVGGTVQVLLWRIPFRQGLLVFISQIILNIFAMAMLSLIFSFFIGMWEGAVASTNPSRNTERRSSVAERRSRNGADHPVSEGRREFIPKWIAGVATARPRTRRSERAACRAGLGEVGASQSRVRTGLCIRPTRHAILAAADAGFPQRRWLADCGAGFGGVRMVRLAEPPWVRGRRGPIASQCDPERPHASARRDRTSHSTSTDGNTITPTLRNTSTTNAEILDMLPPLLSLAGVAILPPPFRRVFGSLRSSVGRASFRQSGFSFAGGLPMQCAK